MGLLLTLSKLGLELKIASKIILNFLSKTKCVHSDTENVSKF